MSFSLVGPWAFGAKLTSAQMNQLDSDHANSLDKSTAGDAIAGSITFTGLGQINANISAAIGSSTSGGIVSGAANGIKPLVQYGIQSGIAGGINSTTAGGISTTVAGGISDGGTLYGIQATVAFGIVANHASGISALVAGGISDGVPGGIVANSVGGIKTNANPTATGAGGTYQGGLLLAGGANDWVSYSSTRAHPICIPLAPGGLGTGWTVSSANGFLTGPATNANQFIWLTRLVDGQYNGSTLTSAKLFFATQPHAGVPASLPTLNITRSTIAGSTGGSIASVSLFSGGAQSPAGPGSGAAWYSSGNVQELDMTPNQNNVIDLSKYQYVVTIVDENGANSVAGNQYFSLLLTFTGIANSGLC